MHTLLFSKGRKRVGIARNLPASLFFGVGRLAARDAESKTKVYILPSPHLPLSSIRVVLYSIEIESGSKFKELPRNN